MLQNNKPNGRAPMLALLTLLLASCASELPTWSPPVEPATIPSLPAEARQPTIPSVCLPTCSEGARRERGSWLNMLTPRESRDRPASEPTIP